MFDYIQSKVMDRKGLDRMVHIWRLLDEKIVFTNGCFDILHPGHVQYLCEAKALGTKLIVGINSDDSVKRLKGPDRPVNDQDSRALVVAALEVVDGVCIFEEDTPLDIIRQVQPDVLVKGGDWPEDKIVGADVVRAKGGSVHSLPFREGHSTTALIGKIRG